MFGGTLGLVLAMVFLAPASWLATALDRGAGRRWEGAPVRHAVLEVLRLLVVVFFAGAGYQIGSSVDGGRPVLGALIVTLLPELLRNFRDFRTMMNGAILVLIVLFLPKGLWDPQRFRSWFKRSAK